MDSLRFKPPLGKIERSCAVLCFLFAGGASANECQNYQNAHLVGTLQQQTFAGPPNYESIAAGDKAERYFLLKLSAPICVNADVQQQEPSFKAITEVQLILNGASNYDSLRGRLDQMVSCKGKLLSAQTGHHHTEVLLSAAQCD